MISTQEWVFMKILDCGASDLSLLNDINYDLDDAIEELMADGCLSLNGIFEKVFVMGATELQEYFQNEKEDIKQEILRKIEEDEKEELIEEEERQELLLDLMLLESGELNPENDWSCYLNYQDTHVFMRHIDFYRKYMENAVDEIEYKMGWNFENID